jgi:hypothetical protein
MTGKDYFNWFTVEEKERWFKNIESQGSDYGDVEDILNKNFSSYFIFCFGVFDVEQTPEGEEYWQKIYLKNIKFDNLKVKPGFGNFGMFKQPKIFKKS